jgi:hypothetical protein
MNRFVRLIFTILSLSIIAGLTVVLLANARSAREQNTQVALEAQRFEELLHRLNGHFRRAEFIVDWQKIDTDGAVTDTALLMREFVLTEEGEAPLHVERIVIPGSEVHMDGLLLDFTPAIPADFAAARGVHFPLFDHVFAVGQAKSERFTFLPPDAVPRAARVHADHITHHETMFWNYVWENRRAVEKGATPPEARPVRITPIPAAARKVRRGMLYTAILTGDSLSIEETEDRRPFNEIRTDAQRMESASRPG